MTITIKSDWQTIVKICAALDDNFPEVDYELNAKKSEEPKEKGVEKI